MAPGTYRTQLVRLVVLMALRCLVVLGEGRKNLGMHVALGSCLANREDMPVGCYGMLHTVWRVRWVRCKDSAG